jgi:hypothetical protein
MAILADDSDAAYLMVGFTNPPATKEVPRAAIEMNRFLII